MSARLPRSFFERDTRSVARELLGMRLVRVLPDEEPLCGIITETEAYRSDDSASHSFRGRTLRNAAMYLQAGTVYVYFTYGMHYCFNVVTEPKDSACAVLVRSLEPLTGLDVMRKNRQRHQKHNSVHRSIPVRDLCRGPARLCQALQIDFSLNGTDMLLPSSTLYIEMASPIGDERISRSPRIGVRGDETSVAIEWRWYIRDSPYVSG
jgi:DNA-3-methyladenine glycosylase